MADGSRQLHKFLQPFADKTATARDAHPELPQITKPMILGQAQWIVRVLTVEGCCTIDERWLLLLSLLPKTTKVAIFVHGQTRAPSSIPG